MKSKYIDLVKENLVDIIYEQVCWEYPYAEREQIYKVLQMEGYDVDPRLIVFIQNLKSAWNHMLFSAESCQNYGLMSVDDMKLYNRLCIGNIYSGAGDIRKDDVKVASSTSTEETVKMARTVVFGSVFSHEYATAKERACGLYCDILAANLFEHGNECVAAIMASCYLLLNKVGYFSVPHDQIHRVKRYINILYNLDSRKALCEFLLEHAIIGG